MTKRDIKRELRELYSASAKRIAEVDVPALSYLMIDGAGDPNTTPAYAQAVEALFTVSYTVKFAFKKVLPVPTTPSCRWRDYGGRIPGRFFCPMTGPGGNGP